MQKIRETGRSMIEMIAVIVLLMILLLVGLFGFKKASVSSRANTMNKDISNAVTERRYLNAQGGSKKEHALSVKVGSTDMVVKNKTSGADAGNFTVSVSDQSKEMCEELKKYNVFTPYKIEVNGTKDGTCSENENEVTFYFNEQGNTITDKYGNGDKKDDDGKNDDDDNKKDDDSKNNDDDNKKDDNNPTKSTCDDVHYTETCCKTEHDDNGCITNKRTFCASNLQYCDTINCTCNDCPQDDTEPLKENKVCYTSGKKESPSGCTEATSWTKKEDYAIDECHDCKDGIKTTKPDDTAESVTKGNQCCVDGVWGYHVPVCPEQEADDCTPCQNYNSETGKCEDDATKLCGGVCCTSGTQCCKDTTSCSSTYLNTCVECQASTDCSGGKTCDAEHKCTTCPEGYTQEACVSPKTIGTTSGACHTCVCPAACTTGGTVPEGTNFDSATMTRDSNCACNCTGDMEWTKQNRCCIAVERVDGTFDCETISHTKSYNITAARARPYDKLEYEGTYKEKHNICLKVEGVDDDLVVKIGSSTYGPFWSGCAGVDANGKNGRKLDKKYSVPANTKFEFYIRDICATNVGINYSINFCD